MIHREVKFRGRRKDNGEWLEGNYIHNTRKGEWHAILEKNHNITHLIYRESLQIQDFDQQFKDI